MDNEGRRRDVLRALGATGVAALAGCQAGDSTRSDESTTAATTTDDTATPTSEPSGIDAAFDFSTTAADGEDAARLTVTGTVSAASSLEALSVEAGEDAVHVDAGGDTDVDVEATLHVAGGRQYEVTVRATGTDGATAESVLETDHVPIHVDPLETDRLVGAHYYPWYEMHDGHENWTDRTVSMPVLGEYRADDPEVVDRHLKWCLEHGIRWLSLSWWGPGSGTDRAIRETLLDLERFRDVQFSVLYETVGRLGAYDYDLSTDAARQQLADDFAYFDDQFFGRENYRRVDGRPVVYFYVANNLRGDVAGAFEAATADIDPDPYVLAGVPFGSAPDTYPVMEVADGVTSYNPYSARQDIEEVFHDAYERGLRTLHLGADAADVDVTPVVIPGFDDTGLPASMREDHPVLSPSPDRFRRGCRQVAPHLADAEGVLVTSFNEWYEDTQLEPGEDFGADYLDAAADSLATGDSPGFDPEGSTVELSFARTRVPAEERSDSEDDRELAFMATGLSFADGGETLASFDVGSPGNEPLLLKGAYGASSDADRSWRWFGGRDAETVLFVETDLAAADAATLTGQPVFGEPLDATVAIDGTVVDEVTLDGGGVEDHRVSLD